VARTIALALILFAAVPSRAQPPEVAEPVRAPDAAERQLIGEYIRAHLVPLRDCYQRRMRAVPNLQGRMLARFDIGSDGKVEEVSAEGVSDHDLVSCVTAEIEKWEFTQKSPGRVRVVYPLLFSQG
jgi:hypothetical protein